MTKRQLFLIAGLAGTAVMAGCLIPGTGLAECKVSQTNEDTGEGYCPGTVTADKAETPSPSVDLPEDPNQF